MNKKDMMRAAQEAEDLGLDPDEIMVSMTLDEFSKSQGDEVDTFDEDQDLIESLKANLHFLDDTLNLVRADIDVTERCVAASKYWSEKVDYQQDLRDLRRKLAKLERERAEFQSQLEEEMKRFEEKYKR